MSGERKLCCSCAAAAMSTPSEQRARTTVVLSVAGAVNATVRCPWHHACFDLKTGAVLRAPALNPLSVWRVERREGRLFVTAKNKVKPVATGARRSSGPLVIVGAGAAGRSPRRCAARATRRDHDDRRRERSGRPAEPLEGLPRRQRARRMDASAHRRFYRALTSSSCPARAPRSTRETRRSGSTRARRAYEALRPRDRRRAGAPPAVPGATPHVHILRTLADSRAIVAEAAKGEARGRHRRELHRPRGRGVAARARPRGRRRRARACRSRACSAPRSAHSCAASTRSRASRSTSADRARSKPTASSSTTAPARRGPRRDRRRRPPAHAARRGGRPRDRPRHRRRRVARAARPASSRPATSRASPTAHGEQHPRRALGRRRAPGPDGRAHHPRRREPLHRRRRSSGARTTT